MFLTTLLSSISVASLTSEILPWFISVVALRLHSLMLGASTTVHCSLLECFWSIWKQSKPPSIFFCYENFYYFLRVRHCNTLDPSFPAISKGLSLSSVGNWGSWPSAWLDPASWKEIALHLVKRANVLVHSCTAIDLTSFWMFTGLAIIPWIFYSSSTIITVITFALLQNLLSKDFKVLYRC